MNSVCLVGRVSRHPQTRFEGESQTASFTLVVEERSYGSENKQFTLYVPCTSWGKSAEVCSLLNQGDLISVQGRLGWRKQVGKCGTEHSQLCVNVRDVAVLDAAAVEVSV